MDHAPARRPDPEALLAHAGWVRALALRLVHDEAGADDVAQDTLTAAWEKPPRAHVPLAPWLARVARNFAFRSLRSRRRRALREAARTPPTAPPSVEESAVRTEMFHDLVGAVLRLEPLYRDVVVLRFFDGLDARAVAERLVVPLETARTRLKRALALLRAHLDGRYGGRATWALALVPLGSLESVGGMLMAASTKTVVGIGLAGALTGAALTLGATTLLDPGPVTSRAEPAHLAAADPAGSSGPASTAAAGPRLEAPAAPWPSASGLSIEDLVRSVEVELPPPGKGRITGHVHTTDGKPLAGLVVRAQTDMPWLSQPWRPSALPEVGTLEDVLRSAIRVRKWNEATQREVRSDASGAFVLEDLADLTYRLHAGIDGYIVRPTGREWTARPGETFDYLATPVVPVAMRVTMPDGTPATEAYVSWRSRKAGGTGSRWSPAYPTVYVEPGTWELTATSGEHLESPPVTHEVGPGTGEIRLDLRLKNSIEGKVQLDPADRAWTVLFVWARLRDGTTVNAHRASAHAPTWTFRFDDLPAGEYDVSVGFAEHAPLATTTVGAFGGPARVALQAARATAAHVLEVRIVHPVGGALTEDDVSFMVYERSSTRSSGRGTRHTRREDGVFLVAVVSPTRVDGELARERAARGEARGGAGGAGGAAPPSENPPETGAVSTVLEVRIAGKKKEVEFVPGSTTRVEVTFD